MNNIKHIRKKSIGTLVLLLFLLSFAFTPALLFGDFLGMGNPSSSSTNSLFKDKTYNITLDDVYDDADAYKLYTNSYFQSQYFNSSYEWEQIHNESADSGTDNNQYESPSNTDITMDKGTFDNSDNMKVNDDSYSEFTGVPSGTFYGTYSFTYDTDEVFPPEFTAYNPDSTTRVKVKSSYKDHRKVVQVLDDKVGDIGFIHDGFSETECYEFWVLSLSDSVCIPYFQFYDGAAQIGALDFDYQGTAVIRFFGATVSGVYSDDTWIHISIRFDFTAHTADLYVDNVLKVDDRAIGASYTELDKVVYRSGYTGTLTFYIDALGYPSSGSYTMGDNLVEIPCDVIFTVDFDEFGTIDTSKLLAIQVQSYHFTNISETVVGFIYNYQTSNYVQMFSSANTIETKNEYKSATNPSYYLNDENLQLKFNLTITTGVTLLSIDYIEVRFFYKMDLWHEISFNMTGIWRYRWELHGSLQYTDWVNFEVVDPDPNFHAISESDTTTRWILQGADISAVENFTDDISGSNWNLYGVSDRVMIIFHKPTDDTYVSEGNPDTVFGSNQDLSVRYDNTWYRSALLKYEYPYFDLNYTSNSTLYHYVYANTDGYAYAYHTSDFSESTATWNNQPATGDYQIGWLVAGTAIQQEDIGAPNYYYKLISKSDMYRSIAIYSTEFTADWTRPRLRHYLSKNYQGGGLMYMQTNETEDIALQSTAYGSNYTLSSGDYFEVDFQTSSDSLINLILLKDGVVNKTLTLSPSANTNFNRHIVKISVDELVEFDQLKISSSFEDTDYIKVYDIKTEKYTITGDYINFKVGSHQDHSIYLNPDIYNLGISEGTYNRDTDEWSWTEKYNKNITIGSTDYYHIYQPMEYLQCRLTLFSEADPFKSLQFDDYRVKINRSLDGEYDDFWLKTNIFSVDKDTDVYINVSDRFDTLVYSDKKPSSDFIDLEIEVYQLEIINLMLQKTTIDINTTLYESELASGRWINFMLSKRYYRIGYYNPNNTYTQFIIYLDSNQVYELNTSRICNIYYTNQQMEPLNFYQFKTYINGTRIINNMFYAIDGEHKGIEVKDLSDISVLNYTYVEGTEEYNQVSLILTMYSLKVMSLQLCFNHINITRDPAYSSSSYYWSEWIAPSEIIDFRLFAGYYKINLTNNEDETYSYYSYTLNGDDFLLIGSNNTIYNVIVNLANVNTTIGNQITNVEINITNQNSNINNTIINIEINLSNINSSLGSILLDINTAITNINSSIITEIVSLGTEITNINSSITNEILSVSADLTNINSSVISQILTLGVDISNINGSIINQIIDLGVDVSNINTSLSNQILSVGVDISNVNTSITNQILLMVADIENVNASIINQTLVMLSDISNVNSTLLNQMVVLGVDITNINATITNQILDLSVDLTNINSSISNLLNNINISITNLENDIGTFYAFTNTSFINLNNVMNTSFINIENNIFSINQTISNLVIGVSNDIYLINGTISTMITQLETNLLLMNVTINTALFDLDVKLDLIGSNITSNYILLNNSIYLNSLNINDSRIAMINNLMLVNNTISNLIADVYSAVYLINNSIYTAVLDLGTYLSLINNTINGNLSIVLKMNDFLTELYKMTMFSDLLNWTDIGLNTTLLTSQIDAWEFINNYRDQSIMVFLRYQDLIENLTVSAQNTIEQYLPKEDAEYRLWSEELQEYINEWTPLPDNKTVDFGFYDEEVPDIPSFDNTSITITLIILIFIGVIGLTSYFVYRYNKRVQNLKVAHARQFTVNKDLIEGVSRPRSSRLKQIK